MGNMEEGGEGHGSWELMTFTTCSTGFTSGTAALMFSIKDP